MDLNMSREDWEKGAKQMAEVWAHEIASLKNGCDEFVKDAVKKSKGASLEEFIALVTAMGEKTEEMVIKTTQYIFALKGLEFQYNSPWTKGEGSMERKKKQYILEASQRAKEFIDHIVAFEYKPIGTEE